MHLLPILQNQSDQQRDGADDEGDQTESDVEADGGTIGRIEFGHFGHKLVVTDEQLVEVVTHHPDKQKDEDFAF